MRDRRVNRLPEELAEPADALAFDYMIGVKHPLDVRNGGHMSADDDRRFRRVLTHEAAHLAHLADVRDDAGNPDDVVMISLQLFDEPFARGEVEQRRWDGYVLLDQHDAPGAVVHAQRKRPLRPRHLVVIELERVDRSAAELIVARERAEH